MSGIVLVKSTQVAVNISILLLHLSKNWRVDQFMQHNSHNNQKIFYLIMQRIGADHKYQKVLLLVWIFIGFTIGSTIFSAPFLLLQSPYKCSDLLGKDCNKYVCSLPPSLRRGFLKQNISSMATTHGDYHCEHKDQLVKAESFVYMGGIGGVLGGAFLSSCLTKKVLFILTVLTSMGGMFLSLFGGNLFMASVGLFLNFAAKGIQIQLIYCFITETVDETKRAKHQTIIFMIEAFGSAMNGPLMYFLGDWKMFLTVMYVIPNVVVLLLLIFFIQQTVYDSLVFNNPQKTLQMIQKIAKINDTTETHSVTLDQLTLIKQNFSQKSNAQGEISTHSASIIDIFAYKSVRNKLLLIIMLGLFVQFNFDGPQLMISQFSMSVYMNGFILGISQVFSCLIGYVLVDDFQRRKMLWASVLIGMCIGLPVAFVSNCTQTCTDFQQIFQTAGLFLFRMAMSFTFTTYILTQFELFPTQVRGMAVQIVSSSGYVSVSMIPVVSKLVLKTYNISAISCFLFNCVVILFLTYFIPQTYNNPPPDVIQELNSTGYCDKEKNSLAVDKIAIK